MQLLTLDIETVPNLAWVWGLWDQNVPISMIEMPGEVVCFSAKWYGSKKTMFFKGADMMDAAFELLDQADAVIHYNGKRFDTPHLNTEMILRKILPPTPFKQIDLLNVVKKNFKFPSNKLQYVSTALGLQGKVETGGWELWKGVIGNNASAWKTMEKYNRNDVVITEKLYDRLLPWINNHPSHALYNLTLCCPTCGSSYFQKRGFAYTKVSKFQQYMCNDCGAYFRDTSRIEGVPITESVR